MPNRISVTDICNQIVNDTRIELDLLHNSLYTILGEDFEEIELTDLHKKSISELMKIQSALDILETPNIAELLELKKYGYLSDRNKLYYSLDIFDVYSMNY